MKLVKKAGTINFMIESAYRVENGVTKIYTINVILSYRYGNPRVLLLRM